MSRRLLGSKSRTYARRCEREILRRRVDAVPHAMFVLHLLAALVVECPRHPDAKRQRARKQRDLDDYRARLLKMGPARIGGTEET